MAEVLTDLIASKKGVLTQLISGGAAQAVLENVLFEQPIADPVYVGAAGQSAVYIGARPLNEVYLGARTLFR